jgi:AcrR family transcriptional regulator
MNNVKRFQLDMGGARMGDMSAAAQPNPRGAKARSRRDPVQLRSKERIGRILDCTADLVDRVGPDQVTTTLIAKQADISVGSIYAYFPDRLAIFDEIVERSIGKLDTVIFGTREHAIDLGETFLEGSVDIIDALIELYRTEPGFRTLWFSQYLSPSMLERMRRSDEEQAIIGLQRIRASGMYLDCPDEMSVMRMYVGIIDKGVDIVFRTDPAGDAAAIDELKRAVSIYLSHYLRPLPSDS